MHALYCQLIRSACIQGEIYFGLTPPTDMRNKVLGRDSGLNGVQKVALKNIPTFTEITNVRAISRIISSYLLFDIHPADKLQPMRDLVVFTHLPQLHNQMMIVLSGQFAAQEAVRKIAQQVTWNHAYGMFKFSLCIAAGAPTFPEIPTIVAQAEYGYCSELIINFNGANSWSTTKLLGPAFDAYLDQPCFRNVDCITILMPEKCAHARELGERLIKRYRLSVVLDEPLSDQPRRYLRRTLSGGG